MCKYTYEDQQRIEDALKELAETFCNVIGVCESDIKIHGNGDVETNILIDEEGSVFHMEISNDGNRVVREYLYMPDSFSAGMKEGGGHVQD